MLKRVIIRYLIRVNSLRKKWIIMGIILICWHGQAIMGSWRDIMTVFMSIV